MGEEGLFVMDINGRLVQRAGKQVGEREGPFSPRHRLSHNGPVVAQLAVQTPGPPDG